VVKSQFDDVCVKGRRRKETRERFYRKGENER
jgi:hypothetical protein